MKLHLRRYLPALAGLLAASLLAGCGGSTDSGASTGQTAGSAPASAPASAAGSTAAASAPASGPGSAAGSTAAAPAPAAELTVWHYWDGNNGDTFSALVDAYQKSHPGQTIRVVTVPNAELLTKVQTAAQSRTLPDIVIGDLVWVPRLTATGKAVDLTSLVPAATWADIYPEMLSFGKKDGGQYSIPVSSNDLAMIYNVDLLKQAGLDPQKLPTTWEELKTAAATITAKTGKPGTELFTQPGDNGEGVTWNFQVNLWQAGGEFLNKDNTKAAFNSDAGRKALQYWVDLVNAKSSPLGPWGAFEKGAAASAQEGSWMVGFWTADQPFDFAVGPIPHPADGKPATNMGGEQAVVFSADQAKQQAAAQFLTWFTDPAQNASWSEKTGFLPVRRSVAEAADYLAFVQKNTPKLKPYIDALPTAKARPATAVYPKVSLAFAKEIEQALHGTKSVEQALTDAEKTVNSILQNGQ